MVDGPSKLYSKCTSNRIDLQSNHSKQFTFDDPSTFVTLAKTHAFLVLVKSRRIQSRHFKVFFIISTSIYPLLSTKHYTCPIALSRVIFVSISLYCFFVFEHQTSGVCNNQLLLAKRSL